MSGQVTYFELPSADIEATQRFWGSLFGWTFYEGNLPGYSMIQGPEPMGGSPHDDPSPHPRIFFAVDDIAAAVARVRETRWHGRRSGQHPLRCLRALHR